MGTDWTEQIVTNSTTGFAFGSIFGMSKVYFMQNPKLQAGPNFAEIASIMGKTSLRFGLIGGIYTVGAASSAAFRSSDDAFNYGVGGALAGSFIGLRSGKLHTVVAKTLAVGAAGLICGYVSNEINNNKSNNPFVDNRYFSTAASKKEEL